MLDLLLAKVRINIPVSGDAATVLAVIGGLMIAGLVVFFAVAKIKEEGRKGWMWLGGWLTAIVSFLATAMFFSRMGEPGGPYFPLGLATIFFGFACAWLMKLAEHYGLAMGFALANLLAMVAKIFAKPPINIIRRPDGEFDFFPAPMTDPKMLLIFVAMAAFAGLAYMMHKARSAQPT